MDFPAGSQRTFRMGTQELACCVRASGSGRPTALFLPGLFAGAWMWTRAFRRAGELGYDAIAIGAPFAKIPVLCKDPIAQFRLGLDALLAELRVGALLVCGNSLGGLMALDYAVRGAHPCRVLASGIPGIGKVNLPGLMLQRAPSREEALIVAQAIFHDRGTITEAMLLDALSCFERAHFTHLLRYLLAVRHYPLRDSMGLLRTNMMLVWGEQDNITPLAPWEASFAADIAGGRVEVVRVPACGHTPMLEKPDEFNRHLARALSALEGSA
jgi:2-hydroxy-6-oxonona-2,4-dienedioate hydrolase